MTSWNFFPSVRRLPRLMRLAVVFLTLVFISRLSGVPSVFADSEGVSKRIASDAFISSDAGAFFQQGQYEKAVPALDALLVKYPDDPLLLRYKAIALDRSGHTPEAIEIFERLLREDPVHTPTRFFMAQAYAHAGRKDEAVKIYQEIISQEETGVYRHWSQEALEPENPEGTLPATVAAPKPSRWEIGARYGYEYDSNVTLKPDDRTVAGPGDKNAGRHALDFTVRYRAYMDRDRAVDVFYATRHTFHDDSLNEFNFTSEEFGIQGRQRVQVGRYDVLLGLRYDILLGLLDGDMFSFRNVWNLSADTRFSTYTRTVVYDRMTDSQFGPDGFQPDRTSRDGFYNDLGVIHYFYTHDFARYLFLKQEFNSGIATGDNFDTLGWTSRVGVHIPVVKRLSADFSTGLQFGFYPNFSSISPLDTGRRRDVEWDLYSALTYQITRDIAIRGFYRYINSWNQNNFYDYTRHIGGTQLVYSRQF